MVDAREYHEETNHSPERLRERSFELDRSNQPRPYKVYEDLPQLTPDGDPDPPETPALAALTTADAAPPTGLPEPSGDPDIRTLCHYATGIIKELERQGQSVAYRAAACTGKLYHVDLYAVTGDCGQFDPGIYHFDPHADSFDVLREGDYRRVLATASGEHADISDAPVTFVATSQWWRNAWKYRERTYRHAFWDSGTVLANLLAVAHGSGHRAEVVAGFADEPVLDLLGLDADEEAPLALVPVGSGAPLPDAPETPNTTDDPSATDSANSTDVTPIDPVERPLSDDPVDYPLVPDAWRQSALADGAAAREWREAFTHEVADAALDPRADDGERVELDPVDRETASARPVGETVERRGSCREYSHDPISARTFATVLD